MNLTYDEALSNFAFVSNLRRYVVAPAAVALAAGRSGPGGAAVAGPAWQAAAVLAFGLLVVRRCKLTPA